MVKTFKNSSKISNKTRKSRNTKRRNAKRINTKRRKTILFYGGHISEKRRPFFTIPKKEPQPQPQPQPPQPQPQPPQPEIIKPILVNTNSGNFSAEQVDEMAKNNPNKMDPIFGV